jgi:hypothetical protein
MNDSQIKLMLDQPSLIIIVDCWSHSRLDEPRYHEILDNIKNFCEHNTNVVAISLISYIENSIISWEDPWTNNSKELFYSTTRWETLRNIWDTTRFTQTIKTHETISNMSVRKDQAIFSTWHILQILYYCNHINSSIKNIYLLGKSWTSCLENRPVGWKELYCANMYDMFTHKKNILSRKSCILGIPGEEIPLIKNPWIDLTDDVIMINPVLTVEALD